MKENVMKYQIPIEKIVEKIATNTEIISKNNKFSIHEDGSLRLNIKTKSHHITKDWSRSNTNNTTQIIINRGVPHGKHTKSRIQVIGSSQENKKIGQDIVKSLEEFIKNNGDLRNDFTLEKTLANEFNHQKRAELLFFFFKKHPKSNKYNITFKDLKNVDFVITDSQTESLEDDLLTLKDQVKRSIFSGNNLQEIKYINESKYHNSLIFTEVVADFNFKYNDIDGVFEVQYGFLDYNPLDKIDKSEFEFKITRVTPFIQRNLTNKENNDIESYLKEEFSKMKQEMIEVTEKKYGKQIKLFDS